MLIIKSPLALRSIAPIGTLSDGFGEKIRGNYEQFGMHITGEDLLHMTMQEPDIYVGVENNGPFMVENRIHMDNHIKLELVNQLINRIMLYDSPAFTYQDEVFVSSVLQKIGIMDVNLFMRQMKLQMEKNEIAISLLNRYFDAGPIVAQIVNEMFEGGVYDAGEIEKIQNEYRSEIYMHNEIFKRLMTAECNNAIYTYHNPAHTSQAIVKSFSDVELMAQADKLHIAQFRENMYFQKSPLVFCDYSLYEMQPLAPDELTRQKAIGRMDAAILENIVNMASYKLLCDYSSRDIWKNYSGILYKSSANVLERFRYFQSDDALPAMNIGLYAPQINELLRDETQLMQLMEHIDSYDVSGDDITLYQDMGKSIISAVFENQKLQKQLTREVLEMRPMAYAKAGDTFFKNVAPLLLTYAKDEIPAQAAGERAEKKAEAFAHAHEKPLIGDAIIRDIEDMAERAAANPPAEARGADLFEIIRDFALSENNPDVPLMENIALLEMINSRNLYMKELLDSIPPKKEAQRSVVVDKAQARDAAFRAIENPEQVLREIYENGTAIEQKIPYEIERILSITDERTRDYYERLMGYRDADMAADGLKTHTDGATDSVIMRQGSESEAADMAHIDAKKALSESEALESMPRAEIMTEPDRQAQEIAHKGIAESEDSQPLQLEENIKNREQFVKLRKEAHELTEKTNVLSETAKSLLRAEVRIEPERKAQEMVHKSIAESEDAQPLYAKEDIQRRKQFMQFRKNAYELLDWIRTKESGYRTYRQSLNEYMFEIADEVKSDTLRELYFHRASNTSADIEHINIEEMILSKHMDAMPQSNMMTARAFEKNVQMVHQTKEQISGEVVEEVLETLQNSTLFKTRLNQENEEAAITQRQLQDIKNEIIRQSSEQITSFMERGIRTQVHAISDMVYLEIERRLKNEQRRRGY